MFINKDDKEWTLTSGEKYAIKWFRDNGFDCVLEKRHISVDYFTVSKNGVSMKWRLPLGNQKIKYKMVMEGFRKDFDLYSERQKS